MRLTYVTRSFLDYRVPVFEALNRKLGGTLTVVFNADYVPVRVVDKVRGLLGEKAVGLRGERRLGPNEFAGFANTSYRFVYQPGLLREIATTRPDVMIGDGFFQWTAFALLHKWRHRTPLVVCYERTRHTERKVQHVRVLYRRGIVRCIDAMCCNGTLSRDYAVSLGMPENRITLGHMVADVDGLRAAAANVAADERAAQRAAWGSPDVAFVVVGRMNERKGIRELLDGWAAARARIEPDWRLIVVGSGPEEDALKARAEELGLADVVFAGHVDYDDIGRLYACADALVTATLEDNWSLVVPEAMACGLPVVCSIYNGCHPELVHDGETGWLFDPLDLQSTANVLVTAYERRRDLRTMGRRARSLSSQFTPDSAAESILRACEMARSRRT